MNRAQGENLYDTTIVGPSVCPNRADREYERQIQYCAIRITQRRLQAIVTQLGIWKASDPYCVNCSWAALTAFSNRSDLIPTYVVGDWNCALLLSPEWLGQSSFC